MQLQNPGGNLAENFGIPGGQNLAGIPPRIFPGEIPACSGIPGGEILGENLAGIPGGSEIPSGQFLARNLAGVLGGSRIPSGQFLAGIPARIPPGSRQDPGGFFTRAGLIFGILRYL